MLPGPLCVALTPSSVADIFAAPISGADCVEARLDYLDDPDESSGVNWADLPVPTIATCRGQAQGGRFAGSIDDECRLLQCAVDNGARFVDIDYRFARSFDGAGVISSYHDFEGTPDDLEVLMDRVCSTSSEVAKIATTVNRWSDNRRLLGLLDRSWPKPVVVIGMGEMGQITRVLGPSRGSALTYASAGMASAPGQLGIRDLLDTYRFRKVGADTRVIGIIGNPVGHSRSPELHNRAFEDAGLDFVYLKFLVDDAGDFAKAFDQIGIVGFSVTIPHKVEIMRYLDGVTREAAAVGAVNTVYRSDGKWMGDNTDVHGIREALKGYDLKGRNVVILGTGGAARAAVAALGDAGSVTLLSRSRPAGSLEWSRSVNVDRIEHYASFREDLLINASPAGMTPNTDASPLSDPIHADTVFDMVYNPARTRLLREAQEQ